MGGIGCLNVVHAIVINADVYDIHISAPAGLCLQVLVGIDPLRPKEVIQLNHIIDLFSLLLS